jgi:hypothetical protein
MRSEYPSTAAAHPAEICAAYAALDVLMARVGVDGLVAAIATPGLRAVVDQHAAAVRNAVTAEGWGLDVVRLAGYARSVEAARELRAGLAPSDPAAVDWARVDWYLLRLLAVCAIAEENDLL